MAGVPLGLVLFAAGAAMPARAADWLGGSALRGTLSAAPMSWAGFYAGGDFALGNAHADFGDSAHDMIAYMSRNSVLQSEEHPEDWTTLGTANGRWTSYGGFVGYNTQWDGGLILGGELGYNYLSDDGTSSSDSMTRIVTPSTGKDTVSIDASSSIKLKDYATLRGRAAYDMGQFLPYAFLGLAVGRFEYSTTVTLNVSGVDNYVGTETDGKDNAISAGVDAGLGVDVALTSNFFLRGEWEYMVFAPLSGVRYTSNVFRGGVGVKF
ncbi:MAG: outer membrane beta-barrel protein [Pseudolabrys sp.]